MMLSRPTSASQLKFFKLVVHPRNNMRRCSCSGPLGAGRLAFAYTRAVGVRNGQRRPYIRRICTRIYRLVFGTKLTSHIASGILVETVPFCYYYYMHDAHQLVCKIVRGNNQSAVAFSEATMLWTVNPAGLIKHKWRLHHANRLKKKMSSGCIDQIIRDLNLGAVKRGPSRKVYSSRTILYY